MVVKVFYNFSQFRHGHLKVRQGEQSTIRLKKRDLGIPVKYSISGIWGQFDFLTFWFCNAILFLSLWRVINFHYLPILTCPFPLFASSEKDSASSCCFLLQNIHYFIAPWLNSLALSFLWRLSKLLNISKVDFARDQCFLQTGSLNSRKLFFLKKIYLFQNLKW